jgi:hypothetical protein
MNMKFLVATAEPYAPTTIPPLMEGFDANNMTNGDAYVVMNPDGKPTLFEWVLIKAILDNCFDAEWYFLLHDTVKLGASFYERVQRHMETNMHRIVRLTPGHSNNMGVIHSDVFRDHRAWFEDMLAELESIPEPLERKKWIILRENAYLNLEEFGYFQSHGEQNMGSQEIYPGTCRLVEYFNGIDLYKIKKNFTGTANLSDTL